MKWAVNSLTFSFPTDLLQYSLLYGGEQLTFSAFNDNQKAAVRSILTSVSAVANITFTEMTETLLDHATLRYAETGSLTTAHAYFPGPSEQSGDSWYAAGSYESPQRGSYAWLTLLHETGHTLGLKHPHDISGVVGGASMPVDRDSLEYTVMSYRSYPNAPLGSYGNASDGYPQTLMMLDIAALQVMYGANYSTNNTDTVYTWSKTTGQMSVNGVPQGSHPPLGNKIFMTVWDGGGNDTYNFSTSTVGLNISLEPGQWSTLNPAQLSTVDVGTSRKAVGNVANALMFNNNTASLIENAIGGTGSDLLVGNVVDNRLTGGAGNDTLNGGSGGTDTAVFSGAAADYLGGKTCR
jgi:serralysin